MRRTTPRYRIQGPDALLLFSVLFLLGTVGLLLLRSLAALWLPLLLLGGIGVSILSLVSSYRYRTGLRDHILRSYRFEDSQVALDIGTGRGLLAIGLAQLGCHAVGMDIWSSSDLAANSPPEARLNARLEEVEVAMVTGDVVETPFREHSFHSVVCLDMIHNLHKRREARRAILEMHRILRRGGRVVIGDLNPFLGPLWSRSQWREELRRAGFHRTETRRIHLTTFISGEKP